MSSFENVGIFEDTKNLCEMNGRIKESLTKLNNAEVVILGAFGCGAFQNKPEVVSRAAKEVITEYLHVFKTIEFAVYCSPRDDTNFRVFKRVLGMM